MTNPNDAPASNASESDARAKNDSTDRLSRGFWYLLLLPMSLLYTLMAREIAGPGYTTAPNQSAMVVFGFLAAVAWPVLAVAIVGIIAFAFKIRGIHASIIGLMCWIFSCMVPFWIGMK